MGELLKDSDMDQLEQWIGAGPKTFTLLYKISRDGCVGTTFHQKCNNQGPTVTVLYNKQQTVYGGYTSQSWTSRGDYFVDGAAFLFRLHFNGKSGAVKMARNGNGNDVYDVSTYGPTFGGGHDLHTLRNGPTFGGGHDLHTFSSTVNNSGGYFTLNGSMAIGTSYDISGLQPNQINNGNMNVTDLEVYKVTDGQREKAKCEFPWRMIPSLDYELVGRLEEDVIDFKVDKRLKLKQARVVLTGPVGVGKSSLCNTINSILKGRVTQKASSGSAEKSLTTEYTQYILRTRSGAKLNFRLCDTPGLEESQGLESVEFSYLLDGHIPNHYEFHPSKAISPGKHGFKASPTLEDKIHMVVFVVDSSKLDILPSKLVDKIKNFQSIVRQKGIPQVMILTKIDEICKEAINDLALAFKSPAVEKVVVTAAETFGLPRSSVLPLKNYENEMDLRSDISGMALLTLRQILGFLEDYIENMVDDLEDAESDGS